MSAVPDTLNTAAGIGPRAAGTATAGRAGDEPKQKRFNADTAGALMDDATEFD